MSNRAAMFAPGVIAGCVAIFTIITVPAIAEPTAEPAAADECLAAPKATTPAGAHWYYRVEKGTKRKCWYLSDAGAKVKAAAKPTPVVEQDKPATEKPMRKSVANARAELTAKSSGDDPSLAETTWPPLTPSADAVVTEDKPSTQVQEPSAPPAGSGSNIASRWPEPVAVASAEHQSTTGAATTPAPVPAQAQPAPVLTPDRLAAAAATPAPAATPAAAPHPVNAAETADSEGFSIRVLLALLVCALALVAIIGPMIFKYARPHRRQEQRVAAPRRPIWDMDLPDDAIRQDPRMPSPTLYSDAPPVPRVLDETVDELEILLARASRRSAA